MEQPIDQFYKEYKKDLKCIHIALLEIAKMMERMHPQALDGMKDWMVKTLELSEDDLEQLK